MNKKGFGDNQLTVSNAEIARLERICDAVLGNDLDAPIRLCSWVERITRSLGGHKQWERWFVHYANENLGVAIASKFHSALFKCMPSEVSDKMNSKAREVIVSILMKNGLTPGEDFSIGADHAFILGEKAVQALKDEIPKDAWEDFGKQGLIKAIQGCPWEAIEKRLGVPFRDNLMARLSQLVNEGRSANVVTGWMVNVCGAVSNQVAGTDEDLTLFQGMMAHIQSNHLPQMLAIIECLFEDKGMASSDDLLAMDINCLCDVAIAAGSSEENGEIEGDFMNRQCLERLALVWRGDRASVPELIAALDKHTKDS
jgi:hypothetical protein